MDPVIDEEAAMKWLAEKWPAPHWCSVCGNASHWLTDVSSVPAYERGKWIINVPVLPVFGVICRNCGHVIWFSAIVAGLMPAKPEPEAEAESDPGPIEMEPELPQRRWWPWKAA